MLMPIVQTLDSAFQWINFYPEYRYWGNYLRYQLDRDLSGGKFHPSLEQLRPALIYSERSTT